MMNSEARKRAEEREVSVSLSEDPAPVVQEIADEFSLWLKSNPMKIYNAMFIIEAVEDILERHGAR